MTTSTDFNSPSHTSQTPLTSDYVNGELLSLDQMLADPLCDHRYVLEQAFKIITLLCKLLRQTHQEYVLDQQPVIFAQVKELKGTYNTWTVLTITVISAAAMGGGGFMQVGAAFPGTSLGNTLAQFSPNFLNFLSSKDWAETLNSIGQGMGGVGQGAGSLGKIADSSSEAKRSFCQVMIEELKRKRSDREDAGRTMRDQCSGALSRWHQVIESSHQAASQVLRGRE